MYKQSLNVQHTWSSTLITPAFFTLTHQFNPIVGGIFLQNFHFLTAFGARPGCYSDGEDFPALCV